MVWRKLHQDVALFRHVLRDAAQLYEGGDEQKLAAKVVGRWPNGTPLDLSPEATAPELQARERPTNDFRYDADPDGLRCPLGAHIRRSNPRDALGFDGHLSFRHRMIRRGMPYGPALPERAEEATVSSAASSSSASRRASRASSRACRRSGSTTATSSASATTGTSSWATRAAPGR